MEAIKFIVLSTLMICVTSIKIKEEKIKRKKILGMNT